MCNNCMVWNRLSRTTKLSINHSLTCMIWFQCQWYFVENPSILSQSCNSEGSLLIITLTLLKIVCYRLRQTHLYARNLSLYSNTLHDLLINVFGLYIAVQLYYQQFNEHLSDLFSCIYFKAVCTQNTGNAYKTVIAIKNYLSWNHIQVLTWCLPEKVIVLTDLICKERSWFEDNFYEIEWPKRKVTEIPVSWQLPQILLEWPSTKIVQLFWSV